MRELWRRLEAQAAASPLSLRLRPPAQESAVAAAERAIGIPFPDDFRASLLLHDGQEPGDGEDDCFEWLPRQARLAPLERIVEEWRTECETYATHHSDESPREIEGGLLYHYLWHPKRIPIAGNPWWDQDNTYLDFFPGPKGRAGQLAKFGKGVFGEVQGPSFRGAIELYVRALESGEWLFRDGVCVARAKRPTSWAKYAQNKLTKRSN